MKKYLTLCIVSMLTFVVGFVMCAGPAVYTNLMSINRSVAFKNLTSTDYIIKIKPKQNLPEGYETQQDFLKNEKASFQLENIESSSENLYDELKGKNKSEVSNRFFKESKSGEILIESISLYDKNDNFIVRLTNLNKIKNEFEFIGDEIVPTYSFLFKLFFFKNNQKLNSKKNYKLCTTTASRIAEYSFARTFSITDNILTDKTIGTTKEE